MSQGKLPHSKGDYLLKEGVGVTNFMVVISNVMAEWSEKGNGELWLKSVNPEVLKLHGGGKGESMIEHETLQASNTGQTFSIGRVISWVGVGCLILFIIAALVI